MTTRYIAKCTACGCHTSGTTEGQHAMRDKSDPTRVGDVYTWQPAPGQYPWPVAAGSFVLDCRKCGQPRRATAVRGKFSASHECNARCLSSTGTVCECSCAGKNHGGSHAA